jgi:2-polyprenyl-3-methyl-5-hydroxy-6-metoxy-1,4-benzoquinol methylase
MVKRRRSEARLVGPRSERELAGEWDKVAAERDSLIEEGRDLSYLYILLPALRKLSDRWLRPGVRVLDVGCGTGKFAAELAEECSKTDVVAIDPSGSSIEIAKEKRPELANLIFERSSVESFAGRRRGHFDLILANMLFQNVASLDSALEACAELLAPGGALVFAVPHPCFWPRYWKYDEEPWFRYDCELWIEAPFRTSLSPEAAVTTTHTHRPLGRYISALYGVGLCVEELVEPYPDAGLEGAYPLAWEFPRFLLGRCVIREQDLCGRSSVTLPVALL